MSTIPFMVGDPAPDFTCPSSNNPRFHFNTIGGRFIVLSFIGSAGTESAQSLLRFISGSARERFDDSKVCFFSISIDPADKEQGRVEELIPGIRHFWDFDAQVSELYGALPKGTAPQDRLGAYQPYTLVLDPTMRVIAILLHADMERHNQTLGALLGRLPSTDMHAEVPIVAPVLIVPRVFEPDFCKALMDYYHAHEAYESGSMTEVDGYTVPKLDYAFKRRTDCDIESEELQSGMRARLRRRLIPEIFKAFQFRVTHVERYIVARYSADESGFFRPHRDNTTKATAHRRFACTINLNAHEYEGGDLRFPEFGMHTYRAPTGGAAIFSCSLLHEATPVTKGVRFATLPFLYDEEGARIRAENMKFLKTELVDLNKSRAEQ